MILGTLKKGKAKTLYPNLDLHIWCNKKFWFKVFKLKYLIISNSIYKKISTFKRSMNIKRLMLDSTSTRSTSNRNILFLL